jgi:hemolysin activation/secretion protein
VLVVLLAGSCRVVMAQGVIRPQDYKRGTKPMEPVNRDEPVKLPKRDVQIADDKNVLVKALLGARFVPVPGAVEKAPTTRGIEIKDLPLIDNAEFRKTVQAYIGKPVTMRLISMIIRDTVEYYQSRDRPVVDVFVPEQEITGGVVQFLVVEAKVGEVTVEGNQFFSADLLRSYIRLEKGDHIEAGKLLDDVRYTNMNPFRFVRPVLEPGKEFGTTNVIIDAKDKFPMRFYAGYEDTGSRRTGLERFFFGLNAGNVFGQGHEAGYQYTTDRHFTMDIHSVYWYIPLANRDKLALFGYWTNYRWSHLGTEIHAREWMLHGRYVLVLPETHNLRHEMEFGVDFRRTESDLQVGGVQTYDDYVDVFQWTFQYGGRLIDKAGDWSWTFNLYWSPFDGVTQHHSDRWYNAARIGSQSEYFYFHWNVERVWLLPEGWSFFNRVAGQLSTERLLPTEQLCMGGYNTVRGFDECDSVTDNGVLVTMELRTPEWDLGPLNEAKDIRHYVQFLTFFDYAHVWNRGDYTGLQSKSEEMLTVGVGLRYRINHNAKLRFDYGHKLEDIRGSESGSGRFHIWCILSY